MGAILTPEKMPDAVKSTLNNLNKDKWIGQMTDLTEYTGFNTFGKKNREQQSAGRGVTVRYLTDHNHSAKHVGLFNTVDYARTDALAEGTVPWRYTDGNMVFDEREERMNSGAEQLVDYVEAENARMMTSIMELAEESIWGKPESSTDEATPFGVEYWITKSASLGFNGGDPVGFSAGRAGISSTVFPRHKNFTGAYAAYDDTDTTGLMYMMNMAADKTKWVAPTPEPGMGRKGYSRGIYTNWVTKNKMRDELKTWNDQLGYDITTGEPLFRGASIQYVPYFDTKTDNPVYMIDANHFYVKTLANWWLKRVKINQLPNQPHCFAVIVSLVWNLICDDLRRQAVFYKAA